MNNYFSDIHYERHNISKAIGIMLIVLGHARMPEYLWRFVSFFHVPLFFFISGMFYKDSYTSDPITLVRKRLKTLYLPFVKYEILFLLFHNFFFKINIYNESIPIDGKTITFLTLHDFLKNLISIFFLGSTEPIIWGFWFIQSLFIVNILFVMLSWFINKIARGDEGTRFIAVTSIALAGFSLAHFNIYLPRSMVSTLISVLYFYLGYIYKKNAQNIKINKYGAFVSFIIILMSVVLYDEHVGFASHEFVRFPYFILNSFAGIYLIFFCSDSLSKNHYCRSILNLIGNNTLHILALHILSFKIVSLLIIYFAEYPIVYLSKYPVIITYYSWLMYFITGIFVPVLIRLFYLKMRQSIMRTDFVPK